MLSILSIKATKKRPIKLLKTPDRRTGAIDYTTAYNHFHQASQLNPSFPNAHYNAAWTAEQLGQKVHPIPEPDMMESGVQVDEKDSFELKNNFIYFEYFTIIIL